MNSGWQKMLIYRELSLLQTKKEQKNEVFRVRIEDKEVLEGLKDIFSHIIGYKKIYIKIFEDMSEFAFKHSIFIPEKNSNKTIDLYTHSLNNFYKTLALIDNKQNYKIHKDLYLLTALLHGAGNSLALCQFYQIKTKTDEDYWIRSAEYFQKILNEDSNMDEISFNNIYETLINFKNQKNPTIFVQILQKINDNNTITVEQK